MNEIAKRESGAIVTNTGWTIHDVITVDELRNMPLGMRIEFVPELRAHFQGMAEDMAASELTRDHLKDKTAECLSVIKNALNWGMDPRAVASKTYAPGKGQIGIEGVLASAIMLRSGRIKTITYEHVGDWSKVENNWAYEQLEWPNGNKKTYKNGDPIMGNVPKWTRDDEEGLGVIATAHMKDGTDVSTPLITLAECQPRNAQTWPTAPKRQIMHVAERALCNMTCGDILMGVHIDVGLTRHFDDGPAPMKDVTPVDINAGGIKGTGEVEPGTPSGTVTDAPTEEAVKVSGGSKRRRIKLTFRDVDMYQTKFLAAVKQAADAIEDDQELENLADEVNNALITIVDTADRQKVGDQVELILEEARSEFVDEDVKPSPAKSTPMPETHAGGLNLAEE